MAEPTSVDLPPCFVEMGRDGGVSSGDCGVSVSDPGANERPRNSMPMRRLMACDAACAMADQDVFATGGRGRCEPRRHVSEIEHFAADLLAVERVKCV